ncbi:MAG TPA: hypothetical protein VEK56_14110 [Vicinamibacterales bacterium]|nr:hypothetical protein [Vicinamibacterales bacterium]
MDFNALLAKWTWKPIRNCPGRFVLVDPDPALSVPMLAGEPLAVTEFTVPAARDTVVVSAFDGGGLISYRRSDGTYLHTLNTREGFARKLAVLGIEWP